MDLILRYMAGHPILAWVIVGAAALLAILLTLYVLYLLFVLAVYVRGRFEKDKSGAKLAVEDFHFAHDEELDEIRLGWTLANHGKFAARRLHTSLTLRVGQMDGLVATWHQRQNEAALQPGARTDVIVRIARQELIRLAPNFKNGSLHLWSHYSSSRPKRTKANIFGAYGPSIRINLAVGEVAGHACVAVIDPTPVSSFRFS